MELCGTVGRLELFQMREDLSALIDYTPSSGFKEI